jgi:hypothetical protein
LNGFLHAIALHLYPTLQPSGVLILGNLSSHKMAGVQQAIVATDAALLLAGTLGTFAFYAGE